MAPVLFPILVSSIAAAQGGSIDGLWQGALDAGGVTLRLALHVTKTDDGKLSGTMDSLDQGANGIPIDSITLNGDTVRLEIRKIGGSYEGTLNGAGTQIAGQWTQGGAALPLIFERTDKLPDLRRPQDPEEAVPVQRRRSRVREQEGRREACGDADVAARRGPVSGGIADHGLGAAGPQ